MQTTCVSKSNKHHEHRRPLLPLVHQPNIFNNTQCTAWIFHQKRRKKERIKKYFKDKDHNQPDFFAFSFLCVFGIMLYDTLRKGWSFLFSSFFMLFILHYIPFYDSFFLFVDAIFIWMLWYLFLYRSFARCLTFTVAFYGIKRFPYMCMSFYCL